MSVVLADAGPLIALFDPRDALHERALAELDDLPAPPVVGAPALTELHYFLNAAQRARLAQALEQEVLRVGSPDDLEAVVTRTLAWLQQYRSHRPDFADGFLVCWAERLPGSAVWTFDGEFDSIGRTLAGRRVKRAR